MFMTPVALSSKQQPSPNYQPPWKSAQQQHAKNSELQFPTVQATRIKPTPKFSHEVVQMPLVVPVAQINFNQQHGINKLIPNGQSLMLTSHV